VILGLLFVRKMLLLNHDLAKNKNMPKRKSGATRRRPAKKQSILTRKSKFYLPWPFVSLILMSVGVLLIGWTFQAGAADVHVTAKVSAALPTGPATILSPTDGDRFKDVPITVSGTCPTDTYVNIYRNNFFSGTAMCTTDGNFALDIDLFPGANKLEAKVFNITDDEGPQSAPITVYYDVPEQPIQQPSSTGETPAIPTPTPTVSTTQPSGSNVEPFSIKSDFAYRGYRVGQNVEMVFEASGGEPPYALNVEWGDGTNTVVSQEEAGKITVNHQYKKAGNRTNSSFVIKISGSDSKGRYSYLQLFLIVHPSGVTGFVANTLPPGPHIKSSWLKFIWPAYGVVILMAVSFWLGEREELIDLKRSRLRHRHT
jgi:hypothetical protein